MAATNYLGLNASGLNTNDIVAEDIGLNGGIDAVRFVTAVLTGTNSQVDFNNLGFTADIIDPPPTGVPEPGTLALFGIGLLGMGLVRRKKA